MTIIVKKGEGYLAIYIDKTAIAALASLCVALVHSGIRLPV